MAKWRAVKSADELHRNPRAEGSGFPPAAGRSCRQAARANWRSWQRIAAKVGDDPDRRAVRSAQAVAKLNVSWDCWLSGQGARRGARRCAQGY
jgi:hypothetical protein